MPVGAWTLIGLPGGLEPRHDQHKELVKSGKMDAYEVRGRVVILDGRAIQPKQSIELSLSLLAAIPGLIAVLPYLRYRITRQSYEATKAALVARRGEIGPAEPSDLAGPAVAPAPVKG